MNRLIDIIAKIINMFIPKVKNSFFLPVEKSIKNNYIDIINNDSNNCFRFVSSLIQQKFDKKVHIFIEYFDENRLDSYLALKTKVEDNNVKLHFIKSFYEFSGINYTIRHFYRQFTYFRTRYWLFDSGDAFVYGKLPFQKYINMNYFITCKNDLVKGCNYRSKHVDYMVTSSLMHSTCAAAQIGVKLDNCLSLGLPRNDCLIERNNQEAIWDWLNSELPYEPSKIIVYAPTYRDDENIKDNRNLFGYEFDELSEILVENKIALVFKGHNFQYGNEFKYPNGVIPFKLCYDFTFYDLMALTDCVITDYSSLGFDYLLLDRPLIYNLYDLDQYKLIRGLSYEPYEEVCGGAIVMNKLEMIQAINDILENKDIYQEKRKRILRIMHKYPDFQSTKRMMDFIIEEFDLR